MTHILSVLAGLTENLIEHIKQTHAKLNMSSLQVGKTTLSKGKDEAILQELTLTFDLLRNLMYQSEEVKVRSLIVAFWVIFQVFSSPEPKAQR